MRRLRAPPRGPRRPQRCDPETGPRPACAGRAARSRARDAARRGGNDARTPEPACRRHALARARRLTGYGGGRELAARLEACGRGRALWAGAGEPRALAHAGPPHRRGLIGPAHGEAVVQRQTGLLATCVRLRRARVPTHRPSAHVVEPPADEWEPAPGEV